MPELPTTSYDQSPEAQQLLAQARARDHSGLSRRERIVEAGVGGGFVLAALALALGVDSGGRFSVAEAALAVFALAVASLVTFEVGSCYTMPLQLVFVPMLFLLPPEIVPLCVAIGLMAGKLPAVLLGRRALGRVPMAIGDSWFSIGPALILATAAGGGPDGRDWPIYVAALAAQFGGDVAAAWLREWLNGGASTREQMRESAWVYLVDLLLTAPGLAVAFAVTARPWVILLVLPLIALMLVFARERRARMDYVLELGRAYRGTALVLGNVVEADDAYTGVHCEGVVALAVQVAEELGLGATARRNVEFGALLHDVGKIVIPKEIINKPGPLDDEEWDIIKTHTLEGQRLLDQVGGFMREVGAIVRSSHEHFDGAGYPDGLVGDAIPLEARIVSCCDAFNAMTTDRSYRAARPLGAALVELRRCAGTQFDPAVVEAVAAVVEREQKPAAGGADEIFMSVDSVALSPR
jgi:putative nucleotidyltransferase with HDIG domain